MEHAAHDVALHAGRHRRLGVVLVHHGEIVEDVYADAVLVSPEAIQTTAPPLAY